MRLKVVKAIYIAAPLPQIWNLARAGVLATETVPTPAPTCDDAQLVARLAAGEADALSLIYNRYAPTLFRVLSAITGNAADAEDALQETFVALATGRVSKIRDLKSYLLIAARHQAYSILRRRKRETHWEDVADLEIAAPETPESPHDFAAMLARLPLEQREVIALKVWEGLTFAEIAEIVKISPNTVMSRYRYGIEKLRAWCGEELLD